MEKDFPRCERVGRKWERSPCGIGSDEIELDSECLGMEAFRRPSQQEPVPGAWFALICVGHESIKIVEARIELPV